MPDTNKDRAALLKRLKKQADNFNPPVTYPSNVSLQRLESLIAEREQQVDTSKHPRTATTNEGIDTESEGVTPQTEFNDQGQLVDVNLAMAMVNQAVQAAVSSQPAQPVQPFVEKNVSEEEARLRVQRSKEASILTRVVVTNNNPDTAKDQNVTIQVGNSYVATVRHVIPFNVNWHVNRMVYNVLKSKQHPISYGVGNQQSRNVPSFSIIDVDPLTVDEHKALAKQQAIKEEAENL